MKTIILSAAAVLGLSLLGEAMTLDEALRIAAQNSPQLQSVELSRQSADQSVIAAGMRLNPELEFEAEDIGGDLDGGREGAYSLILTQQFRLGGKREKARSIARLSAEARRQALQEEQQLLAVRVRSAFYAVLAQQEIAAVRAEQVELGQRLIDAARKRYEYGGGSELELIQAEVALQEAQIDQRRCADDLDAAKKELVSQLGISSEELGDLRGSYYEVDRAAALVLDDGHPQLERLRIEELAARAEADRLLAGDVPDFTLGAGYQHEAADNIDSFVFSAGIPLNIHRRGRAEAAAAMLQAEALQAAGAAARRELSRDMTAALIACRSSSDEAAQVQTGLLPKAERMLELSRAGYEAGRFSFIELVRAQQQLAETKIRYVEALREAHVARAQLEQFVTEGVLK